MRPRAAGIALVIAVATALSAAAALASPEAMKALGILPPRGSVAAPDVTVPALSGAPLRMKDLAGSAVLVNFWATWCTPCQWEMPLMETLYRAYKDRGFVVLAISIDRGSAERVRAFVADKGLTFPVALDPSLEIAGAFGVTGLPATFLVGPDGLVKGAAYGPREWDGKEARAVIESLLPAAKPGKAR